MERISRSYVEADQDRYTLQRSLDLSSAEMRERNDDLRRSSEADVTAERDKLKAVISALGDGLCSLDLAGAITDVNPAGERLLERPAGSSSALTSSPRSSSTTRPASASAPTASRPSSPRATASATKTPSSSPPTGPASPCRAC